MANLNQIIWPSHYDPLNSPIHVENEHAFTSSPERVGAWLIRAQFWPTWYPNSANIKFLNAQSPDLA